MKRMGSTMNPNPLSRRKKKPKNAPTPSYSRLNKGLKGTRKNMKKGIKVAGRS